jgi:hypothetical protein
MNQIDNTNLNSLTKQSVPVTRKDKIAVFLTQEDKEQVILMLKMMEGFKRKLLNIIK